MTEHDQPSAARRPRTGTAGELPAVRVLLVGKGAPDRGGIPTFLDTLVRGSLAQTLDLAFLNVAHAGTPEGGRASAGNLLRTLRDALAVARQARSRDVVHVHTALVPAVTALRSGLLAAAGRVRGAAVVVHVHGGNLDLWLTSRWRRRVLRLAMLPAQHVVAVWGAGARALADTLGPGRVQLIDNGVQVERFAGRSAQDGEPPRILYVGLLTPRKGVVDLLQASRLLDERGVAHRLHLLGGTPDEGPEAEAQVRAALSEQVVLLGTRDPSDMPSAYAQADVFCLPSWWEAMPLSVLEAMASGLPVVASDVGDVARAVEHGRTGLVVPPRSPQELADALELLLTDRDARVRMGAAGRARVETLFSADVMVGHLAALYDDAAGRAR